LPWPASTTGVASKPERADPSAFEAAREPGSDAQSRPFEKKRDAAYSAFSDQNFHKVYSIEHASAGVGRATGKNRKAARKQDQELEYRTINGTEPSD
jgi:hypothetical protein